MTLRIPRARTANRRPDRRRMMQTVRAAGMAMAIILLALAGVSAQSPSPRAAAGQTPAATPPEYQRVERTMGKAGVMLPGDVFKFSFPRSDLKVMVRGVEI